LAKPSGAVIRELRRRKGMTIVQLARRAGIAEKTLRLLEREKTEIPHPETIAAVAKSLGVEPDALFPSGDSSISSIPTNRLSDPPLGSRSTIPSLQQPLQAYLVIFDKKHRLLSRDKIYQDEVTIGRGVHNTIKLSDALVSENHLVISFLGSQMFIRDLGSTNGTFVNNQRISGRTQIEFADAITLGSYQLELHPPDSDPSVFPVHATGMLEEDDIKDL